MSLWLLTWLRCLSTFLFLSFIFSAFNMYYHINVSILLSFLPFSSCSFPSWFYQQKRQSLMCVLVVKIHIILLSFASSVANFILFFLTDTISSMCHWTIRSILTKHIYTIFGEFFSKEKKKIDEFFYGQQQHWKFFVFLKMAKPFLLLFIQKWSAFICFWQNISASDQSYIFLEKSLREKNSQ